MASRTSRAVAAPAQMSELELRNRLDVASDAATQASTLLEVLLPLEDLDDRDLEDRAWTAAMPRLFMLAGIGKQTADFKISLNDLNGQITGRW